jgi:hypothetical protein
MLLGRQHWIGFVRPSKEDAVGNEEIDGVGLAEAIKMIRDELLSARDAAAGSSIQLPVESMTVELKVAATRRTSGRGGFKVPFVELELGGERAVEREALQTVTVVFGGPVDSEGRPVKVAQSSDELKG